MVFDCSAKYENVSVNDYLYKGHGMRNSLVGVLTTFCVYLYALISDICKLYYQCVVREEDFLHFLWYKNNDPSLPIIPQKLTRLSFGLLPAQSASLYCLEKALFDDATNASIFTINTDIWSYLC